jgi:dTDP-4-dehydrorhamnose reductase
MGSKVKNVLVTGASGMVGLELLKYFAGEKLNVFGICHNRCGLIKESKRIKKLQLDLAAENAQSAITGRFKRIDAIIHCAAMTDVNKCELEKSACFRANVKATESIVNLAKIYSSGLIFLSTPMVFSGKRGNYKESDAPNPLNYYARTKLLGEKLVLQYKKGLVLRVNPIGVRPPGAHPSFIQWFVEAAENNRSFQLFSDVRINPISTQSLSKIIFRLLNHFRAGTFHLGSRDVVNKAEIWDRIISGYKNFSGKVSRISVSKTKAGKIASRPKEMWLNVKKAQRSGYRLPTWKTELDLVLKSMNSSRRHS